MMANDHSMEVDVVTVVLKSNDGKCFKFSETEASCSNALKRMLECARDGHSAHIQLPSIDSKVLSNIHQWCRMHCYNQSSPLTASATKQTAASRTTTTNQYSDPSSSAIQGHQELSDWDRKFLTSLSELDLLKLMAGANFLDVNGLYDACCAFMASRWEGMRVEDIRKRYNIRNDLAPETEMQLIQENKKLGIND